jgi:hypothetical protein
MKKRSMLALASLATGFVVAAVTPSHAEDHAAHQDRNVSGAPDTAAHHAAEDGPATDGHAPEQA